MQIYTQGFKGTIVPFVAIKYTFTFSQGKLFPLTPYSKDIYTLTSNTVQRRPRPKPVNLEWVIGVIEFNRIRSAVFMVRD